MIDTASRAHRILRKLGRVSWGASRDNSKFTELPIGNTRGELICRYNNLSEPSSIILFFENGAEIRDHNLTIYFHYSSIYSAEVFGPKKESGILKLSLSGGDYITFESYNDGHINDAWELLRFFMRVREDFIRSSVIGVHPVGETRQ